MPAESPSPQLDLFSVEEWRPVVHFPNYEVSNLGRIRRATDSASGNYKAGHILSSRMTSGRGEEYAYACVDLWRDGRRTKMRVHRVVARAFIGRSPFPGAHVDHINADREQNAAWNLRWCSNAENQAYRNGRTDKVPEAQSGNEEDDEYYEAMERAALQDPEA